MNSRTEKLRGNGARERTGPGADGDNPPFVRWPDTYAWLEGKVVDFWTHKKYGDVAVMRVAATSGDITATGKDEDGVKYTTEVRAGSEVNVGLGLATLEGRIKKEDQGRYFHVAFEHWEQGDENKYRMFAVLELEPDNVTAGGTADTREPKYPENPVKAGVGPGAPGEEGPDYDDEDFENFGDDLPFD